MPSGADLIRQIKERIRELDPGEVESLSHQNGSADGAPAIVDVRERDGWDESHLPGAVRVPRGHLEPRSGGAVPDKSRQGILYCAPGNGCALAAKTLEELGYGDAASMPGGIPLWKDRGYDVEVSPALT